MVLALLVFGLLLRLPPGDSVAVGVVCGVRSMALAWAIGVTLLKRVAYAVVAVVYCLTEVPLQLSCKGIP